MRAIYKNQLRTWIEVDKKAIFHNIGAFRKILKPSTKLMAVVKSNAYGHGLIDFAKNTENRVDWFGVDSITEGLKLRQKGLKKPILVLGYTLPSRLEEAVNSGVSLTVSTFETLEKIAKLKRRPEIHIKIDSGMHRQGFFLKDMPRAIKFIKRFKIEPEGLYTHLAAAKDILYPSVSLKQIEVFKKADGIFKNSGFKNYLRHAAASAGTLLYPEAHLDLVRIGIGLYGLFSTKEIEIQTGVKLKPALAWKSVIGEIKTVSSGTFIGYDLTEKVNKPSRLAIVPVGYWHGFDRGLSSTGEVLINGQRCKVLGRVAMDMIVADISAAKAKVGDKVVIIGKSGKENLAAADIAQKIGTINYEVVTRINPLIKRFYV